MSINSKFKSLPKWVQVVLLLIPFVNWITEIAVRCSAFCHGKGAEQVIVLIFALLPTGILLGWIDLFSCIIQNKLILT